MGTLTFTRCAYACRGGEFDSAWLPEICQNPLSLPPPCWGLTLIYIYICINSVAGFSPSAKIRGYCLLEVWYMHVQWGLYSTTVEQPLAKDFILMCYYFLYISTVKSPNVSMASFNHSTAVSYICTWLLASIVKLIFCYKINQIFKFYIKFCRLQLWYFYCNLRSLNITFCISLINIFM